MGGGGGGGYFSDYDRKELLGKLQETEEKSQDAGFETTVNAYLNDLLSQFNSPDRRKAVADYLEEIKQILSEDIEGTLPLNYGGSVAKHTYVDGLSDVDALVLLGKSDLANLSPNKVRDVFCEKLQERYPKLSVTTGILAVTIKFPDAEVQLLPAVKYRNGYRISDITGKDWSHIKPRKFSDKLTAVNQNNGSKVVPTIKLVKAVNSTMPENCQLKSYHIEALAVRIFENYQGVKTTKAMLTHFFRQVPKEVLNPLRDVTGQSDHVDAYLGVANSVYRRFVSDKLSLIGRKMQNADNARTLQAWKDILDTD